MTKKQLLEADETLEVDYASGYTAYASWNDYADDGETVTGGNWVILYHEGEMPAFSGETFDTLDKLLIHMRQLAPLTKWRISKPE